MNWKLFPYILINSINGQPDPNCLRLGDPRGLSGPLGSERYNFCHRKKTGEYFICKDDYEDRNLIICDMYATCKDGQQMDQSCRGPHQWFDVCKGYCLDYQYDPPPCNHACYHHPMNIHASPSLKCKPKHCNKGKREWVLKASNRPFICEIGKQVQWIQNFLLSNIWSHSYAPHHPLDKNIKLETYRATVEAWPTLKYKAGYVWLKCREGHGNGKVPFKLECHDKPGQYYGKIFFYDALTGKFAGEPEVNAFPCQRDHTACDPTSPFKMNVPANAIQIDCDGRYCKPKCQPGYAQKDLRRYKCGQDHKWYVGGKEVQVLPECITCKDVAPVLNPNVVTNKIIDKTKTHKILKGNGLMELQVNCTSKDMILTINDKEFPGIMTKPTPHKSLICKCKGPSSGIAAYDRVCEWYYGKILFDDNEIRKITCNKKP